MTVQSEFKSNIRNIVYTDKEPSLLTHYVASGLRALRIKHVFGVYPKRRTIGLGDFYENGQFMWKDAEVKSKRLDLRKDPDWTLFRR